MMIMLIIVMMTMLIVMMIIKMISDHVHNHDDDGWFQNPVLHWRSVDNMGDGGDVDGIYWQWRK